MSNSKWTQYVLCIYANIQYDIYIYICKRDHEFEWEQEAQEDLERAEGRDGRWKYSTQYESIISKNYFN